MKLIRPLRRVRRPAVMVAVLGSALLACSGAAPVALATTSAGRAGPAGQPASAPLPIRFPPGWNKDPPLPEPARVHAALGGMTAWQITLLAAGAAVLAAVIAVLPLPLRRAQVARRLTGPGSS